MERVARERGDVLAGDTPLSQQPLGDQAQQPPLSTTPRLQVGPLLPALLGVRLRPLLAFPVGGERARLACHLHQPRRPPCSAGRKGKRLVSCR